MYNFMYFFTDFVQRYKSFVQRYKSHLTQRISLLSGYLLANSRVVGEFNSEIDSI